METEERQKERDLCCVLGGGSEAVHKCFHFKLFPDYPNLCIVEGTQGAIWVSFLPLHGPTP